MTAILWEREQNAQWNGQVKWIIPIAKISNKRHVHFIRANRNKFWQKLVVAMKKDIGKTINRSKIQMNFCDQMHDTSVHHSQFCYYILNSFDGNREFPTKIDGPHQSHIWMLLIETDESSSLIFQLLKTHYVNRSWFIINVNV